MKLLMAVPTLTRYDRLTTMMDTVARSTRLPDRILIVDNGGQLTRFSINESMKARGMSHIPCDLYQPHSNLGVGPSVNYALRTLRPGWFFLHTNDDVEFDPLCIQLLCEQAEANPRAFILPEHGIGSAFTCFVIHSSFRDRIGYFSEIFFPAYFEDNDLGRRMNIAGVERVVAKGAAYTHHTSSTLQSYTPDQMAAHHAAFKRNEDAYIRMWGGLPERETYLLPYDGKFGHVMGCFPDWAIDEDPTL